MVRPVVYNPTKAFKLSKAESEKYKMIAKTCKEHAAEPNSNVASVQDALTTLASYEAEIASYDPKDDKIDAKEVDAEDAPDMSDVKTEEPSVVVADDDDDDDVRSLWGDGDNDPADAE